MFTVGSKIHVSVIKLLADFLIKGDLGTCGSVRFFKVNVCIFLIDMVVARPILEVGNKSSFFFHQGRVGQQNYSCLKLWGQYC